MRAILAFLLTVSQCLFAAAAWADLPDEPSSTLPPPTAFNHPLPGLPDDCQRDPQLTFVGCWLRVSPVSDSFLILNIRPDGTAYEGTEARLIENNPFLVTSWRRLYTTDRGQVVRLHTTDFEFRTPIDNVLFMLPVREASPGAWRVTDEYVFVRADDLFTPSEDIEYQLAVGPAAVAAPIVIEASIAALAGLVVLLEWCTDVDCLPEQEHDFVYMQNIVSERQRSAMADENPSVSGPDLSGSQSATPSGPPEDDDPLQRSRDKLYQDLTPQERYNVDRLRQWARQQGYIEKSTRYGPEQWGIIDSSGRFSWRLKIKMEGSNNPGLGTLSRIPRFDARISPGRYTNPFTGQIGGRSVGTHIPLGG